ncbi:MAG: glycoside hydrolase family 43 protein [Sphaerochaeta sp.]|jgi:arabinan endo-1,5-alpha-L-arabinosidase
MIDRKNIQIRDPFIFKEGGDYYLFGTTDTNPWNAKGVGFNAYRYAGGPDFQMWEGPFSVFTPPEGFWGTHDFWAPELHLYKDKYYLFATFMAEGYNRGTQILVSDHILGPFLPLTDKATTPSEWMCLDGTLFVDGEEKPWIIYCHEWVQIHDGKIVAQQLSSDLKKPVGEPIVLFGAASAPWSIPRERRDGSGIVDARITDGPFMHRQKDGKLVMLWSSIGTRGYAMGCAISDSGSIIGPWRQTEEPLIATDGGHGMIFEKDEKLFVTFHSPNKTPHERFHYVEVIETSDGLKERNDVN